MQVGIWQLGYSEIAGCCAEQRQSHRAVIFLFRQATKAGRRRVAEHEIVRVDVTPAAFCVVHDFKMRLLALQIARVPGRPFQMFVVMSGGGTDHLAVATRLTQVCPAREPPPMRKLRYLRSTINGCEVILPVVSSPLRKLLTSFLPKNPLTACWPDRVPEAGSVPKASPSTVHLP